MKSYTIPVPEWREVKEDKQWELDTVIGVFKIYRSTSHLSFMLGGPEEPGVSYPFPTLEGAKEEAEYDQESQMGRYPEALPRAIHTEDPSSPGHFWIPLP